MLVGFNIIYPQVMGEPYFIDVYRDLLKHILLNVSK
jgi:hypothetical protein